MNVVGNFEFLIRFDILDFGGLVDKHDQAALLLNDRHALLEAVQDDLVAFAKNLGLCIEGASHLQEEVNQ